MDFIFNWDLHPEIPFLRQFVPIRYYSLCFVTGLLLGYEVVKRMYLKENKSIENLEQLAVYVFIGIVFGARVGHCFFYEPDYYLSHLLEVFLPIKIEAEGVFFTGYRGLASHGGTIGAFIGIAYFCRKYQTPFLATLDKIAIAAALTATFIRLGNFMNSEIIGIPTNGNFGVIFKKVDLLPRHPAQLYEAFTYAMIFIVLSILYRKSSRSLPSGYFFGLLLSTLFTARFFIEFIKINQVPFEEGMTLNMGQLLSLPIICIGLLVMFFVKKREI